MIHDDPARFLEAARALPAEAPATARAAFLVAPDGFRLAEESATDNRYMEVTEAVSEERARAEHARLARELAGSLPTLTFPGDPETPDAVFPNNVFATVPGRLVVGRMRHAVRRREAGRADIRGFFTGLLGYEEVDLSGDDALVAELTGPLVVDRARRIGFCGLSERCDRAGAEAMDRAFGLEASLVFDLVPGEYHTNLVLTVLAGRAAVLHPGSFADPAVPEAISGLYAGRTLRLSDEEKGDFVANSIALSDSDVWMSDRAESALRPASREALESWGFRIRSVPIPEIEKAGGSLRCCVAEIF